MNWLIPALVAPVLYTPLTFVDKFIVSKIVKDYRGMPIYGTIMGFVVGTVFWFITGFPYLPPKDALIVITTGCLTIWSAYFYFKAVSLEEASKLTLLFQMSPIMTLILAFLFIGERISLFQLIGFILILGSVIGVSIEKEQFKISLSPALLLIFVVDVMWAAAAVLIKAAMDANSFAEILSYESWGLGIGGTILYFLVRDVRDAFNLSIRTIRKRFLAVMFLNEGVFVLAKAITYFAYSIGSASLVSVVGSTSVFLGILYGVVLTLLLPTYIREDISRPSLFKKGAAALVLFIGLWFVYV